MSNLFDSDDEDQELVRTLEDFEPPVELDTSFSNYIVIDGIPIASEAKYEKLHLILSKIFSSRGTIVRLNLPVDASKNTKGFGFLEYQTKEQANDAVTSLNNYPLDKQHKLKVNLMDDFKKLSNITESYQPPKVEDFKPRENYHQWLSDSRSLKGYDQFVVRYGDYTEICWNEMHLGKPDSEKVATGMTTSYVQWSVSGSYLVTFHPDGIVLYGGKDWGRVNLFEHRGVQLVDFSPEDKYMVTFAPVLNDNPKDPRSIIFWDVRSGKRLRSFLAPPKEAFVWPAFQWSAKDRFFARIYEDKGINVYDASNMSLVFDNSHLPVPKIKDFSWSPTDPIIAHFVPGQGNLPAKITLVEIPTKKVLAEKSIWEALDARMHWQNEGDFLCVKVDKAQKSKKAVQTTSFELFRTHEPNIPIENFEVQHPIKAFAWEPRGKKMCIIHGEMKMNMSVSFYEVGKLKVKLLAKPLENRKLNTIFWSPRGQYVLLANLNEGGELEFYNTVECESLSQREHLQCTGVDWNPSGRYVTTYASHWKVQTDTGYNIWSFAGDLTYSTLKDRFYQFTWRPRPRLMLSQKEIKNIRNNFKKYQEKFDELDAKDKRLKEAEEEERLNQLMNEFLSYLQAGEQDYQNHLPDRLKLGVYEDIDHDDEYTAYETIEELIDVTTQVIRK
eukprot:gene8620-10610_t